MEYREKQEVGVGTESPKREKMVLYRKICKHCEKALATTSRVQVVHDECRIEYYKTYRNKSYKKIMNKALPQMRRRYHINEQPCEVHDCGYMLITKHKKFYHSDSGEVKKHYLCPNHLAEFRMGFLEALTWRKISMAEATSARKAPTTPQATP